MRLIEGVSGVGYRVEDKSLSDEHGHAKLFRCRDEQGAALIYKEYRAPVADPEAVARVNDVIALGRTLTADGAETANSFSWPLDAVSDPRGGLVGVVTRLAPLDFYGPDGGLRTFDGLADTNPPAALRIRLLIRLCELLRFLEENGLVHGSIAPASVAWTPAGLHVRLLECDGMRSAGTPADEIPNGATAWRDPRLSEGRITGPDRFSDRYALARAVHWGHFPGTLPADAGDGSTDSISPGLDPRLARLFQRGLDDALDPAARPDAAQWHDALVEVYIDGESVREAPLERLEAHSRLNQADRAAAAVVSTPSIPEPAVPAPSTGSLRPAHPRPPLPPASTHPVSKVPPTPRQIRVRRRAWMVGAAVFIAISLLITAFASKSATSTAAPGLPYYQSSGEPSGPDTAASPTDGGGSYTSGPTASASSSDDSDAGLGQAQAISQLISQSTRDRGLVTNAVENEVGDCQNVGQGVADLDRAATDRAAELASARQLAVDGLAGGDQLKQALADALSESQQADQAFENWADSLDQSSCVAPAPQNADYTAGDAASQQATAAKTQFIALWQPIATTYDLPLPTQADI